MSRAASEEAPHHSSGRSWLTMTRKSFVDASLTPLRSYTQEREVEASGATLMELLADLDRQYPGRRFHVIDEQNTTHPQLQLFTNIEQQFDITHPLHPTDSVILVQALSGG